MATFQRIRSLVLGAVRAPDEEIHGASADELAALRDRVGRDLPRRFIDLLSVCNGARIGPGGLFGQRPDDPYIDLPSYLDLFPRWTENQWLPVAGDGCGNYYVLLPDDSVGFVDTSEPDVIAPPRYAGLFEFVDSILADDQAKD